MNINYYKYLLLTFVFVAIGAKFITLLPGSRLQEVKRMVPIFLKTLEILKETFSELSAFVLVASNRHVENYISSLNDCWPVPVKLIPGGATDLKYDAFSVRMY